MKNIVIVIVTIIAFGILGRCETNKAGGGSAPLINDTETEAAPESAVTTDSTTIPDSPNTLAPSVMVEGVLYKNTGNNILLEIDEIVAAGYITSSVSLLEWPAENNQTNMDSLVNSPYAEHEDGLIVWWGGTKKWMIFKPM